MANLKWRLATEADLPRIVEIYNQAVAHGIATDDSEQQTVAGRQGWFDSYDDRHPLWVVISDDVIVGWVGLEIFYDHPNFAQSVQISIYFDDQYHHQHFGTQTLNFIDQQVGQLGIKNIVSYIYERNLPSQNLFKKNGYDYVGEFTNISHINGEDRSVEIFMKHY